MLSWIDIAYLGFSFVSIYFSVLFFMLYFRNKPELRKSPSISNLPSISVIIPALNEAHCIRETIRAVKNSDYPKDKLDILVVDDGSTDDTGDIARSEGVKVVRKENQGRKSFALNCGLKHAAGDVVACVDADSYPEKGAFLNAVRFFTDKSVAAVVTSVFVKSPKKLTERLQSIEYIMIVWSRKLLEFLDGIYVTPGALSLYKRDVLEKVGGFDESNDTEDIEIAWRLMYNGYKIKMSMNSVTHTNVPKTIKDWWRQRIRWNVGGIQTTAKYANVLFNRDFRSLGMFVMPFFSFSYVLSIIGFGIFAYIVSKSVYTMANVFLFSQSLGSTSLRQITEIVLLPNIFWIFGFLVFFMSLIWMHLSFKNTNTKVGGLRGILDLLIYLSFFITVFPIILIQSVSRWVRGKHVW